MPPVKADAVCRGQTSTVTAAGKIDDIKTTAETVKTVLGESGSACPAVGLNVEDPGAAIPPLQLPGSQGAHGGGRRGDTTAGGDRGPWREIGRAHV